MNQDQRKFLIAQVEKTCEKQSRGLDYPKEPSLNNYLVAAFLDNTIQINDLELLKSKIRDRVLRLGSEEVLVKEERGYRRGTGTERVEKKYITVDPEDIFVVPAAYLEAMEAYRKEWEDVDQKKKGLESAKDTIIMKIQIGSNQVLDRLIEQVDNMCDLNIMNTQLLLENKKGEQI